LNAKILQGYKDKLEWSKIAYEAKLFIIEAYLNAGLVNHAGKLLKKLQSHENNKNFSHFVKATYYLCQAEYTFLRDENESEGRQKQDLINECKKYIDQAEEQLRKRLLEFFRIGEIAQGNISPLHYYWTK
ncbi:MAG: hypothetical protein ACKPFK_04830, partial [Dolichospermum sp.]